MIAVAPLHCSVGAACAWAHESVGVISYVHAYDGMPGAVSILACAFPCLTERRRRDLINMYICVCASLCVLTSLCAHVAVHGCVRLCVFARVQMIFKTKNIKAGVTL